MNTTGIIIAIATVGGVGLLISIFLSVFGNIFKVEVDEKEQAVLEELPGNNCGGCGYAGCANLAEAIAKGEAPANACPVGGAPVAEKIADSININSCFSTFIFFFGYNISGIDYKISL